MIATKKVRDMRPEERKTYYKALYQANKERRKANTYRWRERYPEKHKQANRRNTLARIADGRAKESCNKFRATHPEYLEEVREANRIRCKQWRKSNPEAHRQWCVNNPDKVAERNWRADTVRRLSEGSFTAEEFAALGNQCLRCHLDDVPMTADHVIPVSKGGTSYISNIQPLCQSCNSSKGSKHTDYRDMYYGA